MPNPGPPSARQAICEFPVPTRRLWIADAYLLGLFTDKRAERALRGPVPPGVIALQLAAGTSSLVAVVERNPDIPSAWGDRVAALCLYNAAAAEPPADAEWRQVAQVLIDGARIAVIDPSLLARVARKALTHGIHADPIGEPPIAVASSTGLGDGAYTVQAVLDPFGRAEAVRTQFLP